MYLIQGRPGAGKTTLALQFLMAGAAGFDHHIVKPPDLRRLIELIVSAA